MILSLYLFCTKLSLVTTSAVLQNTIAPTASAILSKYSPVPVANAALWAEAVAADAAQSGPGSNATTQNQIIYAEIASFQSRENSSNSLLEDPMSSASLASQGLQSLNMYPVRFAQAQTSDPSTTVEISSIPEQTITSFGASGAWWPNDLKYFPSTQQQNLSELLFSQDWLHLSGYRYNMGASGDQDRFAVTTPGRGVESFLRTRGSYDWTRDAAGMYYLKAAVAANVSSITFFVNAAPSALTSILTPCGTSLNTSTIPSFVGYIETVISYWLSQGITIDYVSPMNEPDDSFSHCQQEGMAVDQAIRPQVFLALRAALTSSSSAAARAVKIMGDETSQIASQSLLEYGNWLPSALAHQSIDSIAVHMYDWPDDAALLNFKQLVTNSSTQIGLQKPPPIKMTEISSFASASEVHRPWGWTGPSIMTSEYDPSMDSALDMARMIWQWLTLVNAESFDWWTAVSRMLPCSPAANVSCASAYNGSAGWNDALIYIDPDYQTTKNYGFYLTKRFWVFKHFTTFIRPGAVRYDVPNEILPYGTIAIASMGTNNTWSTIFVNRNATAQNITMKLPTTGGKILGVVQTTDTEDWKSMPLPSVASDDTAKIVLPARGVLSIQFSIARPLSSRNVRQSKETHKQGWRFLRNSVWRARVK